MPKAKPLAIENVRGMVIRVRNAGTDTMGSAHSISVTAEIIKAPTRINAGAVAAMGMLATSGGHKKSHKKEQAGDDRGNAGPAANGDSRRALDVANNRTGTGHRTGQRRRGVGKENTVQARNLAVRVHQPRLLGHRHQRAHVIEQVDEQKYENNLQ